MRILMLTQVVPAPPDAGPKVKTHYVLRTLAREHRVELISFARSAEEHAAARELETWCDQVTTVPLRRLRPLEPYYAARAWPTGTPFLVARDSRAQMESAIRARLASGDIDVLHADQFTMGQYLQFARGSRVKTVFDAHNAVWELVRELAPRQPTPLHRLGAEIEWRLLRRYERKLRRSSDLTLAVSERDLAALDGDVSADKPASVIPIGIEVEQTAFRPPAEDATRLLSVATMHYPPNSEAIRWFRDEIWPLVCESNASSGVDIVGTRPPADIVRWGDMDSRVDVHGYVGDLAHIYSQAAVFIVPLQSGSGVRVKVLEAMARGVPVVSTSLGIEGLDLQHGEHVLVANTPRDFACAIRTLLEAPQRRLALAEAARRVVQERYDWRRCCSPLLGCYENL